MRKIITLFQRNYETDRLVRPEIVAGAEWALLGEGQATVKIDGTSCLVKDDKLYRRYELRKGKTPPPDFIAAQEPDPVTGEAPGWVRVGDGPEDRWHREAWEYAQTHGPGLRDWTYELIGPKVQGNPYNLTAHELRPHGGQLVDLPLHRMEAERTFELIRRFLMEHPMEGIVWWRDANLIDPDCEKVKIKARDFRIAWPVKAEK